jgi:eukaryotic-like serine/threonine-protein kinase
MQCPQCGNHNRDQARFCDSCGAPLAAQPEAPPRVPAAVDPPAAQPELPPAPADAPAAVGGGRFEVAGFLGEGTRKRVYAARDRERGGELVAVSVFNTEGMAATAQARARREADAMAKLGAHPRLVSVLASGQDGERPWVAAEFMPGGDLNDLLDGTPQRRLDLERAISIAADVATALEHAHGAGIVHRDIKPANVWLESDLTARLGDFGLATESRARVAVERTLVGTAAYLPPEQAIGRRTDERADLYSLGALLYEMLTGQPPFPGDDPVSIISRHLSAEPVPVSRHVDGIPADLDALVARLLAKAPDDRPAGAGEVREALARIDPDAPAATDPGEENPLDALAAGLFVGRERESDALRELLDVAVRGNGGVALIEGEPGIGKTRLVEELLTYARVSGARVLAASCHEADAVPAYWPFAQAIRAYVRDADPVGLAWQLGADGPVLARLVPELRERVPSIGAVEPLEGDEARFRFYEAVAGFMVALARSRPLVLAIDDLHWADSSSIELLRFLAHRVSEAPLLIVSAYRQEEAEARENLRRAIAELAEVPRHERIALGGLDPEAIARYVELSAGSAAPPELVADIHEQTGGNPFFVGEVVRLIATERAAGPAPRGRARPIPRGVREAVSRRLERLAEPAIEALEAAAVIGREFEPEVLAEVLGRPLSGELDSARAARILEPRGRGGERLIFAHAVFREALYDALRPARRQELHRRAGEALEARVGMADEKLPALARHFCEAGPEFGEKAREYSLAAARQAAAQLAHADAAEYLERAVGLLSPDASDAIAVRIELGEELTRCGRFADARRVLSEAAAMARDRGEVEALAAAAIGLGALSEVGRTDDDLIALCEEALAALGERLPATRARLLAVIATEHYWTDAEGACQEAGARAVELARSIGEDSALAEVLAVRQLTSVAEPGMVADRLATIDEMLAAARRAGDHGNEARALAYLVVAYLQNADVDAADRAIADYAKLAERLREPRHLWHVPTIRATRAMMAGSFDLACELAREGARLGELAEEPLSVQFHTIQMGTLRSYEGDPEEMLPVVRRMVAEYPALPVWRLALIGFLVEADRHDEARVEYEPVIARGIDSLPRDANWVVGMTRIAEAAARLGDERTCAELLERLRPFAGEIVIVARAAACNGPVDRYLGLTAATLGRLDEAVGHYEAALAMSERMADRPVRAGVRLQLGEVLLERDGPGDRDRAFDVLSLALADGQELGMRRLVERAVGLRLEAQGFAGVAANASIDSVALAVAGERPDLVSFASADGRVTILFSDIENSTLMNERLGDARWIEVLREHNAIFRRRLAELGGYEVKSQGDGFMLAFPDPAAALRCALAVQRDLDGRAGSDDERVRVRIGVHVGEVIEEEGDFFGRSVILAARIAAQARGGEVLASEALHDACGEGFAFDAGRELELKGLGGSHRVFRVESEAVGAAA